MRLGPYNPNWKNICWTNIFSIALYVNISVQKLPMVFILFYLTSSLKFVRWCVFASGRSLFYFLVHLLNMLLCISPTDCLLEVFRVHTFSFFHVSLYSAVLSARQCLQTILHCLCEDTKHKILSMLSQC